MSKKREKENTKQLVIIIIATIFFTVLSYLGVNISFDNNSIIIGAVTTNFSLEDIPEYTDKAYVELNNNIPYFNETEYTTTVFENYSKLDSLGRCGVAYANICKDLMPKDGEVRESINKVKPTGWQQTKVDGTYIYNRCHLIGYQLAAENANDLNLITGTRYFNVEGMLPFENNVAEYIKSNTNNHVLYRVTPIFKDNNLLVSGVEMEAYSVEDNGSGVCFNVYIYNVQPGVNIDYATGNVKTKKGD